ncbi:MAG: methylated-DNA--[protein]-cysteine S-methyltransferase [Clostridia bacterium]|nr:methylated-DNA--[protein]-cysteine S-methyltransferase [Clostridia bacterium]
MEAICRFETPLGPMVGKAQNGSLCGLWFVGQKYFPNDVFALSEKKELPVFHETERWLSLFFQGREPHFLPQLSPHGTAFQQKVWQLLLRIPYGQTTTYGALAKQMAAQCGLKSMSAQAVGGAVGHNPISLLIPCHRVIGANGSLTGYAGGIECKKALLLLEQGENRKSIDL